MRIQFNEDATDQKQQVSLFNENLIQAGKTAISVISNFTEPVSLSVDRMDRVERRENKR